MSDQTGTIHALEYAPQATPDGVRVDRRDGGLTVVISLPRTRKLRLIMVLGVLVVVGAVLGWIWFNADKQEEIARVIVGFWGAFTCLISVIAIGNRLWNLSRPVTISFGSQAITHSRRVGSRIGKDEWPRAAVTGLRCAPAGRDEMLRRMWKLELWLRPGLKATLYEGTRGGVEFLAGEIGKELGYAIQKMQPGQPVRYGRRARREVFPGILEFHFERRLGWWVVLPLIPLAGGVLLLEWTLFDQDDQGATSMGSDPWWALMRVALASVIVWISVIALIHKSRRRKIVALSNGRLISMEISWRSPVREEWPAGEVCDFIVKENAKGTADLTARLTSGMTVVLISGECVADLKWAREQLVAQFKECVWFVGLPEGAVTA